MTAEVIHDIDGTVLTHVGNDDDEAPRSVLRCTFRTSGHIIGSRYAVFQQMPGGLVIDYEPRSLYDLDEPPEVSGYRVSITYLDGGERLYVLDPYYGSFVHAWVLAGSTVCQRDRSFKRVNDATASVPVARRTPVFAYLTLPPLPA